MADGEVFGTTDDGLPVHRFAISGGGLTAHIMNWGAVLQDLRLAGHDAPLVLGFDRFEDYPVHSPYMGAIAGRYANRIADGRFTIAGTTYQADKNFLGKHTLHGGSRSFGKQVWEVLLHGEDFVTLRAARSGRRDGFSGRARCHLHLPDEDTRHAVGRVVGDLRRADALQSRAPLLFQSRRWRQRRHSRPSPDAGRAGLSAGRRGTDPDRRRRAGRWDGVRLPAGAADPIGAGRRTGPLRSQFLPRRRARAAAGRLRGRRARRRASRWKSGRPNRACSSMPARRSSEQCRAMAAACTRPMPASASSRRSGRIRPTVPISRRRCCGRARSTGRSPNTASANLRRRKPLAAFRKAPARREPGQRLQRRRALGVWPPAVANRQAARRDSCR